MRRRNVGSENTDVEGEELPPEPEPPKAPEMELLDEILLIITYQPMAIFVVIAMAMAIVYFAIWCIMPPHFCRRYVLVCRWTPAACALDFSLCAGWIVDPSMARWAALPLRVYRKIAGEEKENTLDFSPSRWWKWRKKSLLPT